MRGICKVHSKKHSIDALSLLFNESATTKYVGRLNNYVLASFITAMVLLDCDAFNWSLKNHGANKVITNSVTKPLMSSDKPTKAPRSIRA